VWPCGGLFLELFGCSFEKVKRKVKLGLSSAHAGDLATLPIASLMMVFVLRVAQQDLPREGIC
jgi:hypothetical protein